MPGFTVGKDIPRMGIRAASNCELAFDNVIVPEENRIGREGEGFKIAMATLDGGRIGVAAIALGIAQGAINETIKYVGERKQFGKTIGSFQNTKFKLAELQAKVDEAGMNGRVSTWGVPCNMLFVEAGVEYAKKVLEGQTNGVVLDGEQHALKTTMSLFQHTQLWLNLFAQMLPTKQQEHVYSYSADMVTQESTL